MCTLDEKSHWSEKAFVTLAALAFGLRFGLNYGISNHTTYLLHGLRLADPRLFTRDWLATQTLDFHHFFSNLAGWLYSLDPSGWIFAWANVLAVAAGGWLIYALARQLAEPSLRLPVFALTLATLMVTGTDSVGNTYLFSGVFQPSTLAALGLLGALLFYLREQYWLSGLCLALGGFFHENYLLLGSVIFFLAQALSPRPRLLLRCLSQLALPSLVLGLYLPSLLHQSLAPGAHAGMLLYTRFRAPHHHVPVYFYKQYFPLAGWLCLATALGWEWFQEKRWAHARAWVAAQVFIILLGTLLTTVVFLPAVSLFFPWRLASLAEVFLMLTVFAGMARVLGREAQPRLTRGRLVMVLAGASLVGFSFGRHQPWFPAFWLLLAAWLFWRSRLKAAGPFSGKIRGSWLQGGALAVWLVFSCIPLVQGLRQSSLLVGLPKTEASLYAWAKSTPVDALFLIPPDLDGFRFWAQRGIVVDWKNTPSPGDMPAWYRRLKDEAGGDFRSLDELKRGYDALDAGRLRALASEYGLDYAVVRQGASLLRQQVFPVVATAGEFVVLACTGQR